MAARLSLLVNRALGIDGLEPGAQLRTYVNGTTTPLSCYADSGLATEYSQPVEADEYGTFPPVYLATAVAFRVLITDADEVPLPGYPMDDVVPVSDASGADAIPFTPTETLPVDNVQDAIEAAAALSEDQTALQDRALTPWVTGGSGNAYTLTPDPALTGYGTFLALRVRFDRANSGAVTLNVNGLGARNIYRMTRSSVPEALVSGDIQPGDIYDLTYDGSQFTIAGGMTQQGTGWRRYQDGLQICWTRATFGYFSNTLLRYLWEYPVEFAETPVISLSRPISTFGTYTTIDQRTPLHQLQSTGANSTSVYLSTPTGAASFVGTEEITNVGLTAIGRWF